jgi:hypothetical protein
VAGEIAVLDHLHPGFAVLDQSKPEGLSQGVAGAKQRCIPLAAQQIAQRVPSQLEGVFKRFDQSLLLAFIELRRLKEGL